jgi:heat-inducible transcriptional repressor
MLSERRRRILEVLVEEYISTAEPVSSRVLVDHYGLGISSATVRNELSQLEEAGYLTSPHVSSGRIPTDSGYRSFVDDLMERARENETKQTAHSDEEAARQTSEATARTSSAPSSIERALRDDLETSASELDDLLFRISRVLTRFTNCLAIVLEPRVSQFSLKKITLVQMDERSVLMVVVVDDGRVLNRSIDTGHERSVEEITAIEILLNDAFVSHEESIEKEFACVELMHNPALRMFSDKLSECLAEADAARVHNTGISSLYTQPELRNAQMAMTFAQLVDDNLATLALFGDLIRGKGVVTRIGSENAREDYAHISIVASHYGDDMGEGVVAVVGPTRMNYGRAIEAIRTASDVLDETLKGQ